MYNKGIVTLDYYNWKDYFKEKLVPTFDINEYEPTHGVVYKKFTDDKYLSLQNFDTFLFQEKCRALSTLVSYLGAKSIRVMQGITQFDNKEVNANLNVMKEADINMKYGKSKEEENNLLGIKEFDETVESFIFLGCKKFDQCASSGGLYGVDREIYKRLRFVNIVSERFNGQLKSFFTIQKKLIQKKMMEIGAYINKLNIGLNINYNTKQKDEIYTFIIEYYPIGKILNEMKIKKRKKGKEKNF